MSAEDSIAGTAEASSTDLKGSPEDGTNSKRKGQLSGEQASVPNYEVTVGSSYLRHIYKSR